MDHVFDLMMCTFIVPEMTFGYLYEDDIVLTRL